jgi:hypothetical protein
MFRAIRNLSSQMGEIQAEMGKVKAQTSGIEAHISGIKTETSGINSEMGGVLAQQTQPALSMMTWFVYYLELRTIRLFISHSKFTQWIESPIRLSRLFFTALSMRY